MYVSEEVFSRIQTQVDEWDKPTHEKLREILKFILNNYGGCYDAYRDSENMAAIMAIPYFSDYTSARKFIDKVRRLLRERKMWEDNRTAAQRNANVKSRYTSKSIHRK
jgi:hypothetical protein